MQATETALGIAEIATQAEADAATDDLRIVTPLKVARLSGATRLSRTAALSVSSGVYTNVPWNDEISDPHNWHDNAVNPDRIVPGKSGTYLLFFYTIWTPNTTGLRGQRVLVNGAPQTAAQFVSAAVEGSATQSVALLLRLTTTTDFVQTQVFQSSGVALDLFSTAFAHMIRLGPA